MIVKDSDSALIVGTLEKAGWIVGGPRGAAAKPGLKRTTLLAKMRRSGISRPILQEGPPFTECAGKCPDLRIELVAARGIRLEVSKLDGSRGPANGRRNLA
jgi:hypothetical protein